MITKTINNRTFLFVEVPEVSEGILTRYAFSGWYYVLKSNDLNAEKFFIGKSKDLFVLIGLASDLTEDEWKGIVEDEYGKLPDFTHDGMIYGDALLSGHSLLQSINLNPHTTLIIEKK